MKKNWLKLTTFVTVLVLVVAVCFVMQAPKADAGMARGSKFVGQIIASSVPSNFGTYWNQVTPENGGKWGSVQSQPGNTYNWGACDTAYNYARSNNMPFKYHCLVWGNQQPSNVTSASQVQTWIKAVAARYSGAAFVDVVNEPLHAVPSYSGVLGGSGSTGWDWVVWSFQQARAAFPSTTKLLINDYNVETDTTAVNNYIKIINILKGKGLIDGIGIQCHQFTLDSASASSLSTCLNLYAQTGLPIYVSELDLTGDDATQLQRYQRIFPVLYEHPSVQGITLWGWIEGTTWKSGTHLITSSGQERPALQWLKTYLAGTTPPPTQRPTNTPTPTQRLNGPTATPTPTRPGVSPPVTPPVTGVPVNPVVTYVIQSDWGNGATISVTIKNGSPSAINGWTLAFTFPGNQKITNLWNGTYTQSGASVSVKDAGFNANIPANGGSVNFGFNLSYSGTNAKPTSFTLNGMACTVQ